MKTLLLTFFIALGFVVQGQVMPIKNNMSPLADSQERLVNFYPNPAITSINFEFQKFTDNRYTLQIYNFVGKKMLEITSVTSKTNVQLNDFFRGVYIFQIRDKTGRIVQSGKFQIVK